MDQHQHGQDHQHRSLSRCPQPRGLVGTGHSGSHPVRGGWRAHLGNDAGEIPTIFVMFTLTMIMFYSILHFSLVYHGRSAIAAAAQDGLAAAQLEDGTAADGEAALLTTIRLANHVEVLDYDVSINGANTEVTARVRGKVTSLMLEDLVSEFEIEVKGPKERFYGEDERP